MVSGKYVDLSELFSVNLYQRDPEPQLLLYGRLMLTSQPKKQCRRIDKIATRCQGFAIYSTVLVLHFPHCWNNLTQNKLLILRTYSHHSSRVWLAYDQPFHKHVTATRLTDWSAMNVQLFNFHGLALLFAPWPWNHWSTQNLQVCWLSLQKAANLGTGGIVRLLSCVPVCSSLQFVLWISLCSCLLENSINHMREDRKRQAKFIFFCLNMSCLACVASLSRAFGGMQLEHCML